MRIASLSLGKPFTRRTLSVGVLHTWQKNDHLHGVAQAVAEGPAVPFPIVNTGRLSASLTVTVWLISPLSVLSSGADSVTVTVSVTAPTVEINVLTGIGGDDHFQVLPHEFLEAGDRHGQLVLADREPG